MDCGASFIYTYAAFFSQCGEWCVKGILRHWGGDDAAFHRTKRARTNQTDACSHLCVPGPKRGQEGRIEDERVLCVFVPTAHDAQLTTEQGREKGTRRDKRQRAGTHPNDCANVVFFLRSSVVAYHLALCSLTFNATLSFCSQSRSFVVWILD